MEIDEILEFALSLPDTLDSTPFGPNTIVIKTKTKIFLVLNLSAEPISFNYKADPDDILMQREDYPNFILPGYHMNKKHWNTVIVHPSLPNAIIKKLIHTSYILVRK